ncbi:hypothetical protein JZU46_00990 [bacterium]|nr:hypothetical protein [bacterium]
MKITEKNMLFPGLGTGDIHSCITKENLTKGLCIKDSHSNNVYYYMTTFPSNKHTRPWAIDHISSHDLYIEEKIVHKVFSMEEMLFMKDYINYAGAVDFNLLLELSRDYKRCSFFVDYKVFSDLSLNLTKFGANFKHKSTIATPTYKEISESTEHVYCISLYDINSIFTNVYKKEFSGVGVSFEIFNTKSMFNHRSACSQAVYTIFTDNYEGIFYRDGKDKILHDGIDYSHIYGFLMSSVERYEKGRKRYLEMISQIGPQMPETPMRTEMRQFGKAVKISGDTKIKYGKAVELGSSISMSKMETMRANYTSSQTQTSKKSKPKKVQLTNDMYITSDEMYIAAIDQDIVKPPNTDMDALLHSIDTQDDLWGAIEETHVAAKPTFKHIVTNGKIPDEYVAGMPEATAFYNDKDAQLEYLNIAMNTGKAKAELKTVKVSASTASTTTGGFMFGTGTSTILSGY